MLGRKVDLRTPQELSRYFATRFLPELPFNMNAFDRVRLQHSSTPPARRLRSLRAEPHKRLRSNKRIFGLLRIFLRSYFCERIAQFPDP